ncbi:cytochrome b5 domain-containing protein [Microaceticoccus formicicus]|uniref:cytochrome b5 domain-containing protein n=1 Tax=Microaceticoccus formicicus TaxID=3118105 RepID=UPI003CCFF8B2|nr:cytochrome b5 domain-containing protein [Peptoniphilaceae bacterium AMB_02]
MKKFLLAISLGLVLVLSVTACSQDTKKEVKEATDAVKEDAKQAAEDAKKEVDKATDKAKEEIDKTKEKIEEKEFTLEELKEFNGKDGKRAYVAVDGVVYDVTDSKAWKDGQHNGFEAGNDLTDAIKNESPHGIAKLDNVVKVGVIKD